MTPARAQAAGHDIPRKELPEEAPRTEFTSNPPSPVTKEYRKPEDDEWLKDQLAFEKIPANKIVCEPHPRRWHRALQPVREQLIAAAKDYARLVVEQKKWEEKRSKRNRWEPNFEALRFRDLDGGLLVPRHHTHCLRVSALTYERALVIANALLFAAETRGCSVEIDERAGRLNIRLKSASFGIAIRERQDFDLVERSYPFSNLPPEKKTRPTNRLALVVDSGGNFQLVDKETQRIEDRLNDVFLRIYSAVVRERVNDRKNIEREKRLAIQRAAFEELTRQREQEAKARKEEASRREMLLEEASKWQNAQKIRTYVAHVTSFDGATSPAALKDWIAWALQVADAVDPTMKRINREDSV